MNINAKLIRGYTQFIQRVFPNENVLGIGLIVYSTSAVFERVRFTAVNLGA